MTGNTPTANTPFTANDIRTAHAKVRSGADFPSYIGELKHMGVDHYIAFVADGHIDYFDANRNRVTIPPKYEPLTIAETTDRESFIRMLKEHQQGKSDYLFFITSCAAFGIDQWTVSMQQMTCTYFDIAGNTVLVEHIPG